MRTCSSLLVVAWLALSTAKTVADEQTYRLTAGNLEIVFDLARKGGIASLRNGVLDVVARECSRPTLFAVNVVEGTRSRQFDSLDFDTFEHQRLEDGIRFRYSGVKGKDVSVEIVVRAQGNHLALDAQLTSDVQTTCADLLYPYVNGYESLSGDAESDRYLFPKMTGVVYHNPCRALRAQRIPTFSHEGYPGTQSVQFHALYNSDGGFVMYAADAECHPKMFSLFHQRERDSIAWSVRHYLDEIPGSSFQRDYQIRLQAIPGSWYDAADVYARWGRQQSWMRKQVDRPAWLDDAPLLANVHDNSNWTRTFPSWIAEHQPEMNAILGKRTLVHQFQRWEHYGNWVAPDSFPPIGGEEAMIQAATEVRGWGGHLRHLFSCARFWLHADVTPEYFENELRAMAVLPRGRDNLASMIRTHPNIGDYVNTCPASPLFQEKLLHLVSKLAEYQHDFISMDIWPASTPLPCYNRQHDHPPGLGKWVVEANINTIKQMQSIVFAQQPAAIFGGEGMAEPYLPWMQVTLMRPVASPVQRDRQGNVEYERIPAFKYIYGDQILTWDGYATTRMPDAHQLLALQFVYGELLHIEDKWHPRFFDLKRIADYRSSHPDSPPTIVLRPDAQVGDDELRRSQLEFTAAINDIQRGRHRAYFSRGRYGRFPTAYVRTTPAPSWRRLIPYDRTPALGVLRHPGSNNILWAMANGGTEPVTLRVQVPTDRLLVRGDLQDPPKQVTFRRQDFLEIDLERHALRVIEWE